VSNWFTEYLDSERAFGTVGMVSHKVLPDGGELVSSPGYAEVGDRGIPEQVIYRRAADKRLPALMVVMEVWGGVPEVVDIRISADRDQRVPLRVKDIRIGHLDLSTAVPYWLAEVAVRRDPDRGVWVHPVEVPPAQRRAAAADIGRVRRRRLTDDLLTKVAVTYRAAGTPKHEAIARAFDVSGRTALRWVAEAKARGLIDE
jgi:hypothetical protein